MRKLWGNAYSVDECVCCSEIEQVIHKKQEGDTQVTCITEHEGSQPVCLDTWYILQTTYFSYIFHIGGIMEKLQGKYQEYKLKCSSLCIDNSLTHYVSFELPGDTGIQRTVN